MDAGRNWKQGTWRSPVGFSKFDFRQTIFHGLHRIRNTEAIKEGYGEGAFVAVAASK
jgi:hypothetical protein